MSLTITPCTEPTALFRQYTGQDSPQPAYIELDLRNDCMYADYNSEIGNGTPDSVRSGFDRRYPIPLLTAEAANKAMDIIRPFAERILANWTQDFDQQMYPIAILGDDAQAAEQELIDALGDESNYAPAELIAVWDVDAATNGCEADEYDITPDTTDERLDEIADQIRADMAECGESGTVVIPGLTEYLTQARANAGAED